MMNRIFAFVLYIWYLDLNHAFLAHYRQLRYMSRLRILFTDGMKSTVYFQKELSNEGGTFTL